jgi:hypothetical protein
MIGGDFLGFVDAHATSDCAHVTTKLAKMRVKSARSSARQATGSV